MLRIHVECPECRGIFDVKAFRAGHRVACKLCGSVVRVPVDGEPVADAEPAPVPDPEPVDQATRDTRPLLRRKSFTPPSKSDDAIYDDIFADTDEVRPHSRSSDGQRFELSRPLLLRIGIGVAILLALYVAYQAGGSSEPPPPPVVPLPAAPSPGR